MHEIIEGRQRLCAKPEIVHGNSPDEDVGFQSLLSKDHLQRFYRGNTKGVKQKVISYLGLKTRPGSSY